jgi:CRP-like cAMP-binding protein
MRVRKTKIKGATTMTGDEKINAGQQERRQGLQDRRRQEKMRGQGHLRLDDIFAGDTAQTRFNDREIHEMLPYTIRKKYHKDDLICLQGDEGDSFFIILSGKVKVIHQSSEGKEVILAILGKDEVFGEMSIIDGRARCATVVALTPMEALSLTQWHFRKLLDQYPEFFVRIMKLFIERLRGANVRIEHLALCTVKERLGQMLAYWASERGIACAGEQAFRLPHTHQEISCIIGTSRESITRTLRELTDEGYLAIHGNMVVIRDMERLKKLGK